MGEDIEMETRKHTAARLIVIAVIALISVLFAPAVAAEGKRNAHQLSSGSGIVRGVVFNDWDQDGERDAEEPTLPGAEVTLFALNGEAVAVIITDLDGAFRFDGIRPGGYVIVERDPLGYSTLGENEIAVIVRDGETTEVNLADVLLLATVEPEAERMATQVAIR